MNEQFFSVHVDVLIEGVRYIPGVCYKINTVNKAGAAHMYSIGKATYYDTEVRFVSGIAYPLNGYHSNIRHPAHTQSRQVVLKLQ